MRRSLFSCLALLLTAAAVSSCGDDGGGSAEPQREVELGAETAAPEPESETSPPPEREPPQREAAAGSALLDEDARRSFEQLAERLGGEVGLTVGSPGDPDAEQLGSLTTGAAWSTIKVPIAARILEQAGGPDALQGSQEDLIVSALTASDNAAAAELFASLGATDAAAAAAVDEVLRAAGDEATEVSPQGRDGFSPYGQTDWPLASQHTFMARLAAGCVGDEAGSDFLLSLMGGVVADQQWGLGSAGADSARFKGGWGPGTDGRYLVRQMGVIEIDGAEVVVTLAVIPSDGQFASGTEALTEMARWVSENGNAEAAEPTGC